ncbi:MAG: hypothetical protein AB7J19_08140, partial [Beijerinckiaceae bacterium]
RSAITFFATLTAIAFCAAVQSPAEARKRSKKNRYVASKERTLTVRGRSFVKSGKHPLPGAEHRYNSSDTQFGYRYQPYFHQGDRYGASILPGPAGAFAPR